MQKPRLPPRFLALWTLVYAVAPGLALADAGTPLMWAAFFHLFLGNTLIGIVEGYLLAWIYRVKESAAIGLMILANYISAWVGGVFLNGVLRGGLDLTIYNAWRWMWVMVFITYLLTLVLEWPFLALSLRKTDRWFRKSLVASAILQTATYVCLFGWYWVASQKTLFTDFERVPATEIDLPEDIALYFISSADGDVYFTDPLGERPQKLLDLNSTDSRDHLLVQGSPGQPDHWDLCIGRMQQDDWNTSQSVLVRDAYGISHEPLWYKTFSGRQPSGVWEERHAVAKLPDSKNQWDIWCGYLPGEGLYGHKNDRERLDLVWETPFGIWTAGNATQLPNDQVIFQLGDDQICILDPDARKVALLARGRGPVVILTGSNGPSGR